MSSTSRAHCIGPGSCTAALGRIRNRRSACCGIGGDLAGRAALVAVRSNPGFGCRRSSSCVRAPLRVAWGLSVVLASPPDPRSTSLHRRRPVWLCPSYRPPCVALVPPTGHDAAHRFTLLCSPAHVRRCAFDGRIASSPARHAGISADRDRPTAPTAVP